MKRIIFTSLLSAFFFVAAGIKNTNAFPDPHIVINEIQIAGASSNDEFIELFNPTNAPIDLEGYKLSKKTKTGSSESALISTTKFSGIIQARGYLLIAHPNYKDKISADLSYSSSTYYISNDNTVLLYGKSGALLDKAGFGTASDFETAPASNPNNNQSIERTDFIDTDNNAVDFSINASPSPQNKSITEDNGEELPGGGESPENTGNNNDTAPDTSDFCAATSSEVRLNEIFPYPASREEFVEVVNTSKNCVDISGWKVIDEAGHKKEFPANSIVDPGGYAYLDGNLQLNNDSDTVYLLGKNGNLKSDALDRKSYEKARKDFSFSFDGGTWIWTSTSTPGYANVITASGSGEVDSGDGANNDTTENLSSAKGIYLNEVLPNPKKNSADEYIEIANGESEPADLYKWTIRDASKTGKYVFKEHIIIEPGEYLAIYKPQSKLALNNSSESIYLYNPKNEITSNVSYEKSQKSASYNFDGESWKWSKYLTPGKKNKFDLEPTVKIKKPKNAFKDLYTEFSVKAKDKETKKLKYVWDFGDGKKSYLAKTSHKYLDTGKYTVTLTVGDDSQTVEKSFVLAVKNYPRPDLEIVKIVPNPVGNDSDGETIDIKNNSGEKVDLRDWKIATGSNEKMYNHPISDGITLGSDEIKIITREVSKFTLNNKSGKVQLVSPDGKIIDEVTYAKEKISEGEAYVKTNGEWQWLAPPEEETPSEKEDLSEINNEENSSNEGKVLGATDENQTSYAPMVASYASEDFFIFLSAIGFINPTEKEINYCSENSPFPLFTYLLALNS